MATPRLLIYGATGYTGRLCAAEAKARGIEAVLAGRNAEKLRAIAEPLGFEHAAVALDDRDGLIQLLSAAGAVLHAAGPFSRTAAPMAAACLAAGVHYCDITGEVRVLETLRGLDGAARDRGVMLLPGAGFDVVPSDCLLAHVASRATDQRDLSIVIDWRGGASRGTARTGVAMIGGGVLVRRDGTLVSPPRPIFRDFDFGGDILRCVATTWGDVATAFPSTGIGNVTAYFPVRSRAGRLAAAPRFLRRLASSRPGRAILQRALAFLPEGPSARELESGTARLLAVAKGGPVAAAAILTVPHPYALTARVAVDIAWRAARGEPKPGYQTPSKAFGPDFILGFAGVTRTDLAIAPTGSDAGS